ncbi:uncharacterized protein MEPE_01123 [Melanopsichium pennsylvanicum]|uniref:Uncharacterized protein n=2 Tax=Melanopsichium pennsylvanicum TaxID=63383 RepID=A0AAJ4XHJ5_9BASI|nr:putative protein [Melanopsichium pennsylvanicum 4]SNX82417.1 uncharacterized protein MEPE_01123 [Melanopsichium pennsylvanicum]
MAAAIIRRAFTTRSAIRAPPAPASSTLPLSTSAATFSAVSPRRVAMLPKASEPNATPASVSHVSTNALFQDVFPQVGSISVPGEQPNVMRLGESS